jgi:hypothetical protein
MKWYNRGIILRGVVVDRYKSNKNRNQLSLLPICLTNEHLDEFGGENADVFTQPGLLGEGQKDSQYEEIIYIMRSAR